MKVLKKICFSLFLLVSLLYLFIIVSPKFVKNFYPFGIRTAIILTGSMEPTLKINDFVIVKKPNKIEVGDIISYLDDTTNKEVLHRVVEINGNEIITKGDANNTVDKSVSITKVTGVYVGRIKYLGSIISFTTKPIVFSLIITFLLIIILIPKKEVNKNE